MRAHLRLVAEALAACAAPASRERLEAFSAQVPALLEASGPRLDDELQRVGEATAFELGLQFGDDASDDPSVQTMVDRRVRIAAWTRVFLDAPRRGPSRPPPRSPARCWSGWASARRSSRTRSSRWTAAPRRARWPAAVPTRSANPEVVNRIGQAAMLQAHTRFLVEALAESL